MEDHYSVNSPRRVLSFSKRKATVSFRDPDDKTSGVGAYGDHGPKTSEVYGFVGSITTIVATVIYLLWAYLPEHWLCSIGIFYYPNRYWALAIPTYAMVTVALALLFYLGLNFLSTPPPTSRSTVYATHFCSISMSLIIAISLDVLLFPDEFSRDPVMFVPTAEGDDELPIEPISDISIVKMNEVMFTDVK